MSDATIATNLDHSLYIKSNLAAELVGDANAPHYGHQRESDKPKKKELI